MARSPGSPFPWEECDVISPSTSPLLGYLPSDAPLSVVLDVERLGVIKSGVALLFYGSPFYFQESLQTVRD